MAISYVSTQSKQRKNTGLSIPIDESVCAFLIDISGFGKPFADYPVLYNNFHDGKVQCVHNMDEASILGITDNDFLNGLLFYHVSQYFDFVGDNQPLYISLCDCSKNWDGIQTLHRECGGKLFQIGIWTAQPIWEINDSSDMEFSSLIPSLQAQADEINGKLGEQTHTMTPVSLMLFGNCSYVRNRSIDYRHLPDAKILDCPKVSVFICQNGSDTVHTMQNKNPNNAPVSSLGIVMACLSLCGAEESIASLDKCDLNKNENFNYPELGIGTDGTPISKIHDIWSNVINAKGYIIPVSYEDIESSYFLSSDQTLCNGDFSTISNNRVIHKCRRACSTALLPFINGNYQFADGTNQISPSSAALMTSPVYMTLDSVMRNKMGLNQISDRTFEFVATEDADITDVIATKLTVQPVNYNSTISEEVAYDLN